MSSGDVFTRQIGFNMMKVDGDGMRDLHVIFHASQKRKIMTRMQTATKMVISQSRIIESGFSSFSCGVVYSATPLYKFYKFSLQENLYHARHCGCSIDGVEEEANGLFQALVANCPCLSSNNTTQQTTIHAPPEFPKQRHTQSVCCLPSGETRLPPADFFSLSELLSTYSRKRFPSI
jgi:hypothetical protein